MEQIINEIEQSMVNLLDNMEMEELHNVLVNTLCGLTIIENKNNKKEKKSKNVYYTVHLNDIYSPYDDKTLSEDDMIEEIKKETSL